MQVELNNQYIITAGLFGLMVMLCQFYIKKPWFAALNSAIKAIFGFVIFNLGVSVFLKAANNLRVLVSEAFGVNAPFNSNSYFQNEGIYYIPVILLGFICHLLIEKYMVKKEKRIANMGGCHVLIRVSLLTTGIFRVVFGADNWIVIVLVSSAICGLWYTLQPKMVDKYIQTIRSDDKAAYGHQTSVSMLTTAALCKVFKIKKRENDDCDKVRLAKPLALLRDMGFCMFALQTIVTFVFGLLCGYEYVQSISEQTNPYLWLLMQGVIFSSGYLILTTGLRMITTELVPAVDALRMKFIPEAKMAMDVPSLFPYGQNAVLYGALSGSIVFITLLFIFAKLKWGFIGGATLYFYMCAGGSAVYGNKVAGKKGAIIGGIITALYMAFGSLLIQKLGGEFYYTEYFCNVCSEPDDRLLLYPIIYIIGKMLFGK